MNNQQLGMKMAQLRELVAAGDVDVAQELLAEILSVDPEFMPAHRWKIDQLIDARDYQGALDLSLSTAERFPDMAAMTATKQAVARDRLGDRDTAIAVLTDLHSRNLQDEPASALFATLLFQTGQPDRAYELYQAIHDANPTHPGALRGMIDIALAQHRPQVALDLCQRAIATVPALRVMALTKQAQCYDELGDTSAAIAALTDLLAHTPNDIVAHLQLARMHQKLWNHDEAEALFAKIHDSAPGHVAAWQGHVAVLMQKGDFDRALMINDMALEALNPVPDAIYRQRAHVLSIGSRPADAIKTLETLAKNSVAPAAIRLDLARAYLAAGKLTGAAKAFARCADHPETHDAGVIGQVRIAQINGDDAAALRLLHANVGGGDTPLDPTAPPALVRLLCDTAIRTDQTDDIELLLDYLVTRADDLSDADLRHVFALAERQALPSIAIRLLESVARRTSLSLEMAKLLLKQAHVMADDTLIEHLATVFSSRLPATQRRVFKVEVQALRLGPIAALKAARHELPAPHTPRDASIIGRFLMDAGRMETSRRYLRRAVRTWPSSRAVCGLYIHVCGLTGHHRDGHAHLNQLAKQFPGMDIGLDRLRLMHSQSGSGEVLELATMRRAKGLPGLHPRQYLDLCLASGDLELAGAAMHDIRTDPDSSSRVAAHFTIGLQGRMLTDLRLFRAVQAVQIRSGQPTLDIRAQLAEQYYYPAKCILSDWITARNLKGEGVPKRAQDTPIPARIFQYWDTQTPPAEVADLIAQWQAVPDFEHTLYDRTSAIQTLRQHFGPRCVRAFQRARHVTEESDFLRLCLIYKFGGLYIDADDKRVGDIGEFATLGAGLVVAREPIGAVANNTLVAPPGHPVLRIAVEMTMRSLLANENDGAWFKTGPGMLTRAIARYITENDPAVVGAELTILDAATLRRYIQPHIRLPYKTTVKYWNAQDRKPNKRVLDSFMAL